MRRLLLLLLWLALPASAWAQNFTCTQANVCTFSGAQSLWPAGSDSAPTIALSTDTDTGIRFPAAGEVSFILNGTETTEFTSTGWRISASGYINFGATAGTGGYGLRDNAGTMQFKDSGGAWTNITAASSGAPIDATYITQTANATLSAEQALSALSTGIMRVATTTGVITSLTDSAGIAANLSDESGSGALIFGTSPTLTTPTFSGAIAGSPTASGTWTFANAGFGIYDSDASHALRLVPGSNLTMARNLTITTGDAARTVTINGDVTLNAWFDQSVLTTADPTFNTVGVNDSNDSDQLLLAATSNLTADRTLSIATGDADRTLTLSANLTVNAASTVNQDVSSTGSPTFNALTVTSCTGCAGTVRTVAPGGRCTLTSGTAVTTSDVTAATTLYYTPFEDAAHPNEIRLYDGSAAWGVFTLSELSIAVPATTSTMYDVFVYNNAGTPTLESTAWTNDTTRATALVQQNEVWVRSGATTRLYVCSFRTTTVSGQTEDSFLRRFVWNNYNRVVRAMRRLEGSATWTYNSATRRQANANTANQLDVVVGLDVSMWHVTVVASVVTGSVPATAFISIGLDSTTADATGVLYSGRAATASDQNHLTASLVTYPGIGRHTAVWLEASDGTGTWYGTSVNAAGINGWMEM